MKLKPKQNLTLFLANADAVVERLKLHSKGTRLRIRRPRAATITDTDGWMAVIGDLGKNQSEMHIWLDRISGYTERKFCACFFAPTFQQISAITRCVSQKLWPVRTVTTEDTKLGKYRVFTRRLRRSEFNVPILEKYDRGHTYYGIYDPSRETPERVNSYFCDRAVAFFEDVARALPHAAAEDIQSEVYPRYENRKRVASHLQRERSRLLATECKIRDNYECQVCGLRFEEVYLKLGISFAEAHHRIPLGKLRDQIRTTLEDLATVCANCHRMLHRMAGQRDDIKKLRAIVRNGHAKRK